LAGPSRTSNRRGDFCGPGRDLRLVITVEAFEPGIPGRAERGEVLGNAHVCGVFA
jgi:hypothetical protein